MQHDTVLIESEDGSYVWPIHILKIISNLLIINTNKIPMQGIVLVELLYCSSVSTSSDKRGANAAYIAWIMMNDSLCLPSDNIAMQKLWSFAEKWKIIFVQSIMTYYV